jgi:hypothetical protein
MKLQNFQRAYHFLSCAGFSGSSRPKSMRWQASACCPATRGCRFAGQGRDHGHRRGADRVPADLQHRPPHPGRRAAGLRRREGQGVRHRHPDRRHPRGDPGLLAEDPQHLVALPTARQAQRFALNVLIAFLPAVVLGLLFGKAIKEHLFTPAWWPPPSSWAAS